MTPLWMTPLAREDLAWWRRHDRRVARQLLHLMRRLSEGACIPSARRVALPLRLPGLYAVRVQGEHRLVIELVAGRLVIHQCRFHY
ncbi:type II toxin-antitoxin system YoeB family toxin [Herbaspirillum huttiense]|uniref:Type II toxin-antitoxin system YoeB family toxin n=1 Tax=Herbaspirillum huttiense subsp. lycopersici TaxID=3074428 RepID=A0ABU2EP67_9BURK|nr:MULTISPECIES: type II toxin-antitoxin system YoeB family toxin [Herbaspirillum]MBN9358379.1 type II toxin-antitoxin system YoeB family toxin [Herbaspirillum huttiense]MBP1315258.1 toxin YoeB [Herbaspirillum sp. 1130]MCO4859237.1 type II toxin-antitoxin system YoeB family toxin [Herbaspirillum sp. WGmk3]MCP3655897.1 type II toxin-antitoxin system YoeB family toxin [Herbaspirillum sp.]MCP3948084.1 type II toxin-antitoxin system YoeB family toxin [Herbaspirillum sp.]